MVPGTGSHGEKEPIASFSKQTNRASWFSDTDFETDPDEDVLINGGPVHRYSATVTAANRKKRPYSVRYKEYCATRRAKKRTLLIILIIIFLIIIIGLVYLYYSKTSLKEDPAKVKARPVVHVQCGYVVGVSSAYKNGVVYEFNGLRYAQAPTGQWRWKAPLPLTEGSGCWKSPYDATMFGSQCAQLDPVTNAPVGSEDCLFLNVHTPILDEEAHLPVMVWIHGGGLMVWNGSVPAFSPGLDFSYDNNVVTVSINYRLNVFGFLSLDVLSTLSSSNASGNYGFMDQIQALRWVKKNIKAFGGDPNSITIAGQGSGGTSVFALLASPLAKGLFTNAISMSGSAVIAKSSLQASKENQVFLSRARCSGAVHDQAQCLYNLTTTEALRAMPFSLSNEAFTDLPRKGEFHLSLAVVDGYVLPHPPEASFQHANSCQSRISLLIGTTAQETSINPSSCFINKSLDTYSQHIHLRLDTFSKPLANEAISLYGNISKRSLQLAYETMNSDVRVTCPNNHLALSFSKSQCLNVFRYVVSNTPSHSVVPGTCLLLHAFRSWDVITLFGFKSLKFFTPWSRDILFQKQLREQFVHFLKFGHPLASHWSTYPLSFGIFGDLLKISREKAYHDTYCNFWNTSSFYKYAWIN